MAFLSKEIILEYMPDVSLYWIFCKDRSIKLFEYFWYASIEGKPFGVLQTSICYLVPPSLFSEFSDFSTGLTTLWVSYNENAKYFTCKIFERKVMYSCFLFLNNLSNIYR